MRDKPNIVLILLDDFGWRDAACYGSTFYETPNIDRLCSEGMQFSDAYAACPVCSPTRASILSGKYPARVGVTNYICKRHPHRARLIDAPYIKHLPLEEKSVAAALREGGYQTWHLGKWHLGDEPYFPEHHGFDINVGGCAAGAPYAGGYFSPWNLPSIDDSSVPEGTYLTDYLTDEAIKLIRSRDERPFFMNMWYYTVHEPIEAKQEYIDYFENKGRAMGLDMVPAFESGEVSPMSLTLNWRTRRRLVQSDPVYAAMIKSMDENVGRLMQELEEAGEAEDTVLIFTSDNGGLSSAESSPTCNAPLAEGKGWMYEGGTREPLIVRWPGVVAAGSKCSVPTTSPDFYPTFLDIAGLPLLPDQHVDGVSLVPLLRGATELGREAIFWHYPHYGNQGGTPGASVRAGDWKLIRFFEDEHVELYNLRLDVGEERDVADRHPAITERLANMLGAWMAEVDAEFPEPNPAWPW